MTRVEIHENVLVAFDTVRTHKVRSALTVLGIVIGVTSVISVASIIQGLNGYVAARVEKMGSRTYFLTANAQYSCSLGLSEKCFVIIVFPDLLRTLKALVPTQGVAILAHELGHVYHQHHRREISPLQAQIEADEFAFQLGLGHDLSVPTASDRRR